jgi:hypothetical protein
MMPSPQAIAIILSLADRAMLEGWTRRRKTAQSLALRARIVLGCAAPGATNGTSHPQLYRQFKRQPQAVRLDQVSR